MALIDVSDLLVDPDFMGPISLVHRVPTMNSMGENTLATTTVNTIGCVQPASGSVLQRLPDALRVQNVNSFWIKGEIIADGTNEYPDQIIFQGNTYEVQHVFDWTNWGRGFCEGVCVRSAVSL